MKHLTNITKALGLLGVVGASYLLLSSPVFARNPGAAVSTGVSAAPRAGGAVALSVGSMQTQIAFVHAGGNNCPPACAFNLRLIDPLNPGQQMPLTAFPVGTTTEPPVWSKDFLHLAFASTLNSDHSLEPLLSVYAINADGTNLRQLTGRGVLVPFTGPTGTVSGRVVPAPAHSPMARPPGTFSACTNPLPPSGISGPCQLDDGTYLVPGTLLSCSITAQGIVTFLNPPCDHLHEASFVLPNVPVLSSWVRALATVTYNDPLGVIPSTPQPGFFGFESIIVQAGRVTDAMITVEGKFDASSEPSWSRDGTELVLTGTGYITAPQIQGNLVVWKQDVSTDLDLQPANVGGPVAGCSPIDLKVGGCIGTLQVVNAADGTVDGTLSPPSLAAALSGSDWSRVEDRIATALNGAVLGIFGAAPVRGIVVMNPMNPRGSTARLILLPNSVLSTVVQLVKQARWSPDGLRIAFTQTTVNSVGLAAVDDLFVVDAGGGHLIQLTQNQTGQEIDGVSWSPDGQRIAFDVVNTSGPFPNQTPTSADIFAINVGGTGRVQLTADGRSFGPAWGRTPLPDISVTPLSRSFGGVAVGLTSTLQTVTIRNNGTTDLTIGTITKGGANPGQFKKPAAKDLCSGKTLAPTGSCTVRVGFRPTNGGSQSGTLLIPSNDPDGNPVTIALSGTGQGPEITMAPGALDFGNVLVGSKSPLQTVTVQNVGTGSLTIGAITKGGANPGRFKKPAAKDLCSGQTLAPTGSCTVGVRFGPTNGGPQSATLVIPSNDFNENPLNLPLTGTGTP